MSTENRQQASLGGWIEGARLRTLPAAAAPVFVGVAAAFALGAVHPSRSVLALLVALLLQVGVNYSNDYSDGIRGTDDQRSGPQRLTGSGLARPRTVLKAALGCFAAAGVLGLVLVAISGTWPLIAAGIAAVAAAWFYTGGKHPYGYWNDMDTYPFSTLVAVAHGLMLGSDVGGNAHGQQHPRHSYR